MTLHVDVHVPSNRSPADLALKATFQHPVECPESGAVTWVDADSIILARGEHLGTHLYTGRRVILQEVPAP
jgi:hypothetical protein